MIVHPQFYFDLLVVLVILFIERFVSSWAAASPAAHSKFPRDFLSGWVVASNLQLFLDEQLFGAFSAQQPRRTEPSCYHCVTFLVPTPCWVGDLA